MIRSTVAAASLSLALLAPAAASAQEVFGGVYAHDVDTPLNLSGDVEHGVDLELGWRGAPIRALHAIGSPSPHVLVTLNTAGDTHFAAAGVSWKFGSKVYVRPGIGLAVHTGPSHPSLAEGRIDFGSRVLFEPELGVGVALTDRASIEASWVHLSHATLFSDQNPGMDTIGVRLNYRFR